MATSNDDVLEYEGNEAKAKELINSASVIFCLDFNDLRRTDMMYEALNEASTTFVMIDHHQDPSDFATSCSLYLVYLQQLNSFMNL